mgnify:CR=1 FL=1
MEEKDILVLDIETKNTFQEVRENNFDALEVSLIGLYSYGQVKFFAFDENEIAVGMEMIKNAGMIIGFSISRFDLPVLQKHFGESALGGDIFSIPRLDILDEIEFNLGKRVGLDILAKANLGYGKNGHSLDAGILYREGKIEELKNYCLNDVKITKELYELAKKQGYLMIPQKGGKEEIKLEIDFNLWQILTIDKI